MLSGDLLCTYLRAVDVGVAVSVASMYPQRCRGRIAVDGPWQQATNLLNFDWNLQSFLQLIRHRECVDYILNGSIHWSLGGCRWFAAISEDYLLSMEKVLSARPLASTHIRNVLRMRLHAD